MELAHDDSLRTIDDEFAAAEQDRNISEINIFFENIRRPFTSKAHLDAPWISIGQAEFATFRFGMLRFAE